MQRYSQVGLAAVLSVVGGTARAQTPAPPGKMPDIGQMAPDFVLPGATRYGLLAKPVKLSDFHGKTVVLAFFYQARTKG